MFKMSSFNNQKATTYIAYMMISSYFNKAYMVSKVQANRLFLDYQEMPAQKQFKTEERILSIMDRIIRKETSEFEKLNCEVVIRKKDSFYEVRFDTLGFGSIIAFVDEQGKIQISI